MKPLLFNVLIEEEKLPEISESGLIVTNNEKEPNNKGKVLEIGKKVTEVKIDDRVLFKRYLFDEIEIDKKKYLIGKEENITMIL